MGNPYDARVAEQTGKVRIEGTVTFTDPANQPGGGGYTAPITRAVYSGDAINIADGNTDSLTWDSLDAGTALLDIVTDNQSPTVITAGVYALSVTVLGATLTATGYFVLTLVLDLNGDDAELRVASPLAAATQSSPRIGLCAVYYLPAGAVLRAQVANGDGAAARDFSLVGAVLQRIS